MSSKRKGKMVGAMEALANAVVASTSEIVKHNNEKGRKLAATHHDGVFHSAALPVSPSPEELFSSMLTCIFGEDHPNKNTKKRKRVSAAAAPPLHEEEEEVVVRTSSSAKRKVGRRLNARRPSRVVDTVSTAEPSTARSNRKPGRSGKPPRTPQPVRDEVVAEHGSNLRRNPGRRARTEIAVEPKSIRGHRGKPSPLPPSRSGHSIPATSPAAKKGRKSTQEDPAPASSPVIQKGKRRRNNKPTPKSSSKKKAPEPTVAEEKQESDGEDMEMPFNASQLEQKSPVMEVITIEDNPDPSEKRKKTKSSKADETEDIEKSEGKPEQDEDDAMGHSDRDDPSEKDEEEEKEKPVASLPQKPKRLFNPTVLAAPKPRIVRTAVVASTAGPVRRAAKTLGVKKPLRKPSLPAHVEPSKQPEIKLPEPQPQQAPPSPEPTPPSEENISGGNNDDDEVEEVMEIKDDGGKQKHIDANVPSEDQVEVGDDLLNLDDVQKLELNDVQEVPLNDDEEVLLNDVEADQVCDREDANEADGEDEAVEIDAPAAGSPSRKKTFTLEPLFPKSIFAAASPARPVQKKAKMKSISFAIPTESKKRKTESNDDEDGSSKRMKSRFEGEPSTSVAGLSSGKSTLRERIENMRKRASQKSVGTPYHASEAGEKRPQDTPQTKSSGFYSAKSRAQSSTSLETGETSDTTTTGTTDLDAFPSLTKQTPTRALSFSMKTPVQALEKRFNMASPDEANPQTKKCDVDVKAADNSKSTINIPVMNNLLTSVSSFLPTNSNIFGYPTADPTPKKETSEEKAARIAREQKLDDERREAEMVAKREGARLARQAEAKAKQRKVLEHKRKLEEDRKAKEIEQKRKEDDRMKRLRDDLEARKKKKAEDERKRELRQQRAKEHREKIAAAENARRQELERKANPQRQVPFKTGGASSSRGGPSSSGQIASSSRPGGLGTPSILKKGGPVTSYEMSAERKNTGGGDSDSDSDGERHAAKKGKKIPEWASKSNVLRALERQTEDPDKTFSRVQSVNLEDVFASTQQSKIRYRSRNSSGAWTKDRLTAKEEMEYKKKSGFI